MFGFPFITSLIIAVGALTLASVLWNKGMKKRQEKQSSEQN